METDMNEPIKIYAGKILIGVCTEMKLIPPDYLADRAILELEQLDPSDTQMPLFVGGKEVLIASWGRSYRNEGALVVEEIRFRPLKDPE